MRRIKKSIPEKIVDILIYTGFIMFTFVCTYPFYYLLINSFGTPEDVINGIYLLPPKFTLMNYRIIFASSTILNAIKISGLRTIIGTVASLAVTSFFAYLVTKNNLPCRKLMYRIIIVSNYISAGLIPGYMLYTALGLKNNFLVYIIPNLIYSFNVVLIKTYMESIPASLEESAKIDGAGFVKIFYSIIIPMSVPILAAIAVFSAVDQWNTWRDNLYFANTKELKTLPYYLYGVMQQAGASGLTRNAGLVITDSARLPNPMSIKIAVTMVSVLPIMMVYPLMQRFFVKGLMLGAVKG